MVKPRVFISSTVHDFKDLRSAIKYWLEEVGFDVQISEDCSFDKDSSQNSYDACLNAVANCDYFILLIGERVGGDYFDGGEKISITRKEYRVAYENACVGQVHKIITFVRQSVLNVIEDRRALNDVLFAPEMTSSMSDEHKKLILNHESKIIEDFAHIKSFYDEVTRKADFKDNMNPPFNWVHSFNSFEEIVSALKVELRLDVDISQRVAEHSLKMALIHNMQEMGVKYQKEEIYFGFMGFRQARERLAAELERNRLTSNNMFDRTITFDKDTVARMAEHILFCKYGIDNMDSNTLERLMSSGAFLYYNRDKKHYENDGVCRAIYAMIREIKRLKMQNDDLSAETLYEIQTQIKGLNRPSYTFSLMDISQLNCLYERKNNIYMLSSYVIRCLENPNFMNRYPKLLHGFVESERPTEDDINCIFSEWITDMNKFEAKKQL